MCVLVCVCMCLCACVCVCGGYWHGFYKSEVWRCINRSVNIGWTCLGPEPCPVFSEGMGSAVSVGGVSLGTAGLGKGKGLVGGSVSTTGAASAGSGWSSCSASELELDELESSQASSSSARVSWFGKHVESHVVHDCWHLWLLGKHWYHFFKNIIYTYFLPWIIQIKEVTPSKLPETRTATPPTLTSLRPLFFKRSSTFLFTESTSSCGRGKTQRTCEHMWRLAPGKPS